MGSLLLSSQDIHLAPLHRNLSYKDVSSSLLWINGSHRYLRVNRHPDRFITLPSTFTFLGSCSSRYLWISSGGFLKLGRAEFDYRFDGYYTAYAESMAPSTDIIAKNLGHDYLWDWSCVSNPIFSRTSQARIFSSLLAYVYP